MCGIAGFFGDYNPNLIKNMTDSLYRRGPDEEGFYQDELCSLGIRRLSIIDLKSGSQPYFNEDKRYVCVFNGEIYNFKELRGELEKKGHRFRGFSDGEILPHLYEDHKEEAFAKLRGMFAFALYDKTEKKLILARDHFGIKPLFYFIDGNKIYFASEIKAFKKIDFLDRKIDSRYLNNYFYLGYSPGNSSIYEKIKKLPPAGILIFSQGRENIMKYWSFPKTEENKIDKNFLEETSFILEKAVREQTVSDVPLGIFLSGGMDSSSILYFAGAKGKNKVKTFTASFGEETYDESEKARLTASYFNCENISININPSARDLIDFISSGLDQPFADSSILANYLVSKEAAKQVKTALSGLGGDELFAGYPRYLGIRMAKYLNKIPKNLIKTAYLISTLIPEIKSSSNWPGRIKRLFKGIEKEEFYGYWLSQIKDNKIFFEDIKPSFVGALEAENPAKFEFENYLEGDLLYLTDISSMYASLEIRVPFLDIRLIEKIASLPLDLKTKGFEQKYILKKIMKDLLPSHCFKGKKGFQIPLSRWFCKELKEFAFDLLYSSKEDFYEKKSALELLENHCKGKTDNSDLIYSLCVWELWIRNEKK